MKNRKPVHHWAAWSTIISLIFGTLLLGTLATLKAYFPDFLTKHPENIVEVKSQAPQQDTPQNTHQRLSHRYARTPADENPEPTGANDPPLMRPSRVADHLPRKKAQARRSKPPVESDTVPQEQTPEVKPKTPQTQTPSGNPTTVPSSNRKEETHSIEQRIDFLVGKMTSDVDHIVDGPISIDCDGYTYNIDASMAYTGPSHTRLDRDDHKLYKGDEVIVLKKGSMIACVDGQSPSKLFPGSSTEEIPLDDEGRLTTNLVMSIFGVSLSATKESWLPFPDWNAYAYFENSRWSGEFIVDVKTILHLTYAERDKGYVSVTGSWNVNMEKASSSKGGEFYACLTIPDHDNRVYSALKCAGEGPSSGSFRGRLHTRKQYPVLSLSLVEATH